MDQLSQVAASFTGFLPGLPNSINFMCVLVCECACVCGWRGEADNVSSDQPTLRPNGPQLSVAVELN